jgi:GNAT superfamily N-acetyltransferase
VKPNQERFRIVHSPSSLGGLATLVPEHSITRAFTHGCMGWALAAGNPAHTAAIVVGDFVLPVGRPDPALIDAVRAMPGDTLHILPAADDWQPVMDSLIRADAHSYPREVFDWRTFDHSRFQSLRNIGERTGGHPSAAKPMPEIKPINEQIARMLLTHEWSRDIVGNFNDPADAVSRGFGFVAVLNEVVVSAIGCYTCYADGVEVEVDTHPDYRRRGFAGLVSRAMFAEAIDRGLAVGWDAMNGVSAALARSLGYTSSLQYQCLEVQRAPTVSHPAGQ